MKRLFLLITATAVLILVSSDILAQRFHKSEYAGRRERLMAQHNDGLIIVMGAAARTDYYRFFQNNNFMYLTGVAVPDAFLVIDPMKRESILFANLTEFIVRDCGEPVELATNPVGYTGLTDVRKPDQLAPYLEEKFKTVKKFYTCFLPEELPRECSNEKLRTLNRIMVNNEWDGRPTREMQFVENLRQRFIGVVVEDCSNAIHETSLKVFRPGIDRVQAEAEIAEILTKQGFDMNSPLMKALRAGFGHYVGMAVHDVGGSPKVLRPGMVIANEPYTFFADENLGVRVENTILITETGCENLTPGLPRTVAEIEAFMKNR